MVWEFLYDFFKVFVDGIFSIFYLTNNNGKGGLIGGVFEIFNIRKYILLFQNFKSNNPTTTDWVIAIIGIIFVFLVLIGSIILLFILLKKLIKRLVSKQTNDDLYNEISRLRAELKKSEKNRDRLLKLKLQGKGKMLEVDQYQEENGNLSKVNHDTKERFYKLIQIDKKYETINEIDFDNCYTLEKICEDFRVYCCKELKLYYDIKIIRLFISALATTKTIVLQGISGTGKTSLPYAFGKWLNNDATVVPVQPYWRDRSEIFGYFNEFSKKYNETEILRKMYEARYNNQMYLTIIDEANIARVEYYFAELLSILEMPNKENWVVDITSSSWESDPKYIVDGRFRLPENMWYVLTINNDESTFNLSDKVYDRVIPININTKAVAFDVGNVDYSKNIRISYDYIRKIFTEAQEKYKLNDSVLRLIDEDADKNITAVHDVSAGGLAVALSEMVIKSGLGCEVTLTDDELDKIQLLYSESHARYLLTVKADALDDILSKIRPF